MLDGMPLIDVHLHAARLPTLKLPRETWLQGFAASATMERIYDAEGTVVPSEFDAYLAAEGVDTALLMCEYSPKVTGLQVIEDMLPIAAYAPDRIKVIANVNPHLHYPVDEEVRRQLAPGAANKFGDPVVLDDVLRDFRSLTLVLAHGGRGWWYDAAAFLALSNDRVWIELSGLPPSRLRDYYARQNWNRLTKRMIFGTDWPGIPGIAANARAVARLMPDEATAAQVLAANATRVYNLKTP